MLSEPKLPAPIFKKTVDERTSCSSPGAEVTSVPF